MVFYVFNVWHLVHPSQQSKNLRTMMLYLYEINVNFVVVQNTLWKNKKNSHHFIPSNQLFSDLFSKCVAFTKILPKKRESIFPQFPHYVIQTERTIIISNHHCNICFTGPTLSFHGVIPFLKILTDFTLTQRHFPTGVEVQSI